MFLRWGLLAAVLLAGCARHDSGALTVSAAASLQNALQEIARQRPDLQLEFNFGGSGMLAQQIAHGAPAGVFLSAASKPMDDLAAQDLLLPGTRRDLLRNELVLVAPAGGPVASFADLASPAVKLIALGDPGSVPAGDYGRQVLQSLHLWYQLQSKLVLAKDVRQVLTYVEAGSADAGLVYATDARESKGLRVAATAPAGSHAPILYPAAVLKTARDPAAATAFVSYLTTEPARRIFEAHGFTAVAP